jgi:hypothetical protein
MFNWFKKTTGHKNDWRDKIEVGDILLDKGKFPRVVRGVAYRTKGKLAGRLLGIDLVIQRCSWTGRCYTAIGRADLKQRGFVPTGKKKTSINFIDKLIAHDLMYTEKSKQKLSCCMVKGIT